MYLRTLLHYLCKSGVEGMGNAERSLQSIIHLIENCGANPGVRCKLNDMTPLHVAAFYDVASVIGYLVNVIDPDMLDSACASLDMQTPLHIAASNLCLKSVRVLLSAGANVLLKDNSMRTPLDCVPDDDDKANDDIKWYFSNDADIALEMRTLLEEATLVVSGEQGSADIETMKTAKVVLSALGLDIGDRVVVGNAKIGTLRYCGPTQFSSGIWTGVELDEPIGKNDGSIDGVQYFICLPDYGIFAPINKISKLDPDDYDLLESLKPNISCKLSQINGKLYHHYSTDYDTVQSKVDTGLNRSSRFSESNGVSSSSSSSVNSEDIHIGSRVFLSDNKIGIVRFIGMTQFASGIWYGIELNRPFGKNDGSIQGVRYFHCQEQHGIFVQFPRIVRVLPAHRRKAVSNISSEDALESDTSSDISMNISGHSSLDLMSTRHLSNSITRTLERSNKTTTVRRSVALRRSVSVTQQKNPNDSWLRVGVNVLVNGMFAVVRYIGPVHFANGIFLGVELRTPNGKNDGSIDGEKYFSCK